MAPDQLLVDKSSSAELSEAINSMYAWYRDALVCYAYLDDVEGDEDPADEGSSFRQSEWFTRGWTLQELIAPTSVVFIAKDWFEIGSRSGLAEVVEKITKVDEQVLVQSLSSGHKHSVAKRMSWAAKRKTSRPEDQAYSLMGLFGINMPPLYGEGVGAFFRLQQEILKVSKDHSIFAWDSGWTSGLLAESPALFDGFHDVEPMGYVQFESKFDISAKASKGKFNARPDYALTNFGIRMQLPLQKLNESLSYAYLACHRGSDNGLMRMTLAPQKRQPPGHYLRSGSIHFITDPELQGITIEDIYIAGRDPLQSFTLRSGYSLRLDFKVAVTQIPSSSQFELIGSYPTDLLSSGSRLPTETLPLWDDHEVLLFQDPSTKRRFAATFGGYNLKAWSDVTILEQGETAEMMHHRYKDSSDLENLRHKHCDWAKKPLAGNTGSVLVTVRSVREDTATKENFAVRIIISDGAPRDLGSSAPQKLKRATTAKITSRSSVNSVEGRKP